VDIASIKLKSSSSFQTGAENHQEVCPVDEFATDEEKNDAQCDRDEGDIVVRLKNAAQAYMEWLPIRFQPGTMGVIDGSFTQIIEWGNLATFVVRPSRKVSVDLSPQLAS